MTGLFFPAEWFPQSGVQVTWPHEKTDWCNTLEEVTQCYVDFSKEILKREKLLVVCADAREVSGFFTEKKPGKLQPGGIGRKDTGTRDHGGGGGVDGAPPILLGFGFKAWGPEFAAYPGHLIS